MEGENGEFQRQQRKRQIKERVEINERKKERLRQD